MSVIIVFNFNEGDFTELGLNTFSDIKVTLGNNTYSLSDDPDKINIDSNTELRLNLNSDASLKEGYYLDHFKGLLPYYLISLSSKLEDDPIPMFRQ